MFNLKKTCGDNCPFSQRSLEGWLGEKRAEGIYQDLLEGHIFVCHKTIDYDENDDEWSDEDDQQYKFSEKNQFCAGAMIMLKKMDQLNECQPLRIAQQLNLLDSTRLDLNCDVFSQASDFIAHHSK